MYELLLILLTFFNSISSIMPANPSASVLGASSDDYTLYNRMLTPAPTATPTPIATPTPTRAPTSVPVANPYLDALNVYREKNGVRKLAWSSVLADYAHDRAFHYDLDQHLDNHDGFRNLISDPSNYQKMGFTGVAENAAYNVSLDPTILFETVFAGHDSHNAIQLDPRWTHVGIAVNGKSVDVVFGRK
jgi:uncharacterized protein YkwD